MGGERQARQGDELHACRAARGGLCCVAEGEGSGRDDYEMRSELKPKAAASVKPARAARARAAAEMMSEQKPKAAANVKPIRAISCMRA